MNIIKYLNKQKDYFNNIYNKYSTIIKTRPKNSIIKYSNMAKELLINIVSKLKTQKGIIYSFLLIQIIFVICFIDLNLPVWFVLNESNAMELFKSRQSEIITLFGSAIAIFAIIFSIIQVKKEYEESISIMFKETYFFPFLGFSSGIIIDLIIANTLYLSKIINTEIFIKISILSMYSVLLEIFFIILIIFRIYILLVTDLLFEKFIEDVKKEALETTNIYSNEKFISDKKRLYDKYNKSILENDPILTKKITRLFIEIFIKNVNSFFTIDFNRNIYLIFEQSVNQGNRETCRNIINIIIDFWNEGIENQNESLLKYISLLPTNFYDLIENKHFHKTDLAEDLLRKMYEVFNYILKYKYNENITIHDLKLFNKYSKIFISSYINLLKRILEKRDIQSWKYGINYLKQLGGSDFEPKIEYELRGKLSLKEKEENKDFEEIKLLKEVIVQKEMLNKLINLTQLGLYSWLIDLIIRDKFPYENFETFSNEFQFSFETIQDNIEVLLLFYRIDYQNDDLGWKNWTFESEERLPGKVYWTPSTSDWLIFGFVFKLIKDNIIHENDENKLDSLIEAEQFEFIDETINRQLDYLKDNYENKFVYILGITNEELIDRISIVKSFFKSIKEKHKEYKLNKIAFSKISESKSLDLKNKFFNELNESQILFLFKYFKSISENTLGMELKEEIGEFYFPKCKRIFIDEIYREMPGFNLVNVFFDRIHILFLSKIFSEPKPLKKESKISQIIDESISNIKKRDYSPDLILIDYHLFYQEDYFYNELIINNENLNFIGNIPESYYINILIVPIHDRIMKNKILIADFGSSFKLRTNSSDDNLESIFNFEIIEINKEMAQSIFDKEHQGNVDSMNIDLEKELIKIMNDIIFKVSYAIKFEIINSDSFEVFQIEESIT
jgi:hypothetical protein